MILSRRTTIFVNFCSIVGIIAVLIKNTLNGFILLLAVAVMMLNIYNITNSILNPEKVKKDGEYSPIKRLDESRRGQPFDQREFEERVKQVFQRNAVKSSGYFEEENRYWNNKYFYKNNKIEELKDLKVSELSRDRVVRNEDEQVFRFETSTNKKIRNYLEPGIQVQSKANLELIENHFRERLKMKVPTQRIKECLKMLEQHIYSTINNEFDTLVSDFNSVDRFLHKCFSASLTLQPNGSNSAITIDQLKEIVKLIEVKDVIPNRLTPNFSPLQIKKELASVRQKVNNLSNFSYPPGIFKLSMFLKYLRKELDDIKIVFSGIDKEETYRQDNKNSYMIKYTSGYQLYYMQSWQVKSALPSSAVLMLMMHYRVNKKIQGKNRRSLLRDICSMLEV